jgi:hypothetical protein
VTNRASTTTNVMGNSTPLPSGYTTTRGSSNGSSSSVSSIGNTRRTTAKRKTSGFVGRLRTWNKDVVCIPYTREITLSIPRGKQRGALSERGLIGKIRIMSTWNDMQVTCRYHARINRLSVKFKLLYLDFNPLRCIAP